MFIITCLRIYRGPTADACLAAVAQPGRDNLSGGSPDRLYKSLSGFFWSARL